MTMQDLIWKCAAVAAVAGASLLSVAGASAGEGEASVHDFEMNRIDGAPQKLSDYEGKVVVIVNVASKCGLTPQYEQLQALYEEHKEDGLVVLGFPANNFGKQEPGTNKQIAEFCDANYGVSFPMFEKVSVTGDDRCALYDYLAGLPDPLGGEPKWNFTKFIVDREGRVVARFEPRQGPDNAQFKRTIESLLQQES